MNALVADVRDIEARGSRRTLLGLGTLVRKDLADWTHGRKPWIVLVLSVVTFTLSAANSALNAWVLRNVPAGAGEAPPKVLSMLPNDNILFAVGTQAPVLVAIFATMSLIVAERDAGTLAWTVSKPVSRTSVLVSKWLTSTVVLWLVSVLVPLLATAGLVTVLYGAPSVGMVAVLAIGLAAATGFFVAVTLTAGTLVPTQAGVVTIALAVFAVPALLVGVVPVLAALLPTSIYGWVTAAAMGQPVPFVTPVATLVALAAIFVLARNRFAAMEL
jgi:hypothetical protein